MEMERFVKILNMPFSYHLLTGALIRLLLIVYAEFHDSVFEVPYTDVDYKVYTDAARHILNGSSPFKRHTYRYSPVIAYMLIPAVLKKYYGKMLFTIFDICITAAIKCIIEQQTDLRRRGLDKRVATYSSLLWLYNPMSIAITTRGNADSLPCFIIIWAILFIQTKVIEDLQKCIKCGVLLGISIHLRLYPIVFSFPMYLSLGEYKINRNTYIKDGLRALIPNWNQIALAVSTIITLCGLTVFFYARYGYEFLFETYIYHLIRNDTRHNFSVLFYYSYLTDQLNFDIVKYFNKICECVVLFVISLSFGCSSETLPFALFSQAMVLVTFNSVVTSQYFVWFLSLLPLVAKDFKMRPGTAMTLFIIWLSAQGSWLYYAYLLEFMCREVYLFIWGKGVLFFCANIYILAELIQCYSPGYAFGMKSLGNFEVREVDH